jgi:glycosyltransferase domain-containing protein
MSRQDVIKIEWGKMSNLSELTIIIPTYNRQNYAQQQMHFWSNSPVKIHVLDGTINPINIEHLKGFGENVHYYHMPYSYEERISKAVDLVDTEYVTMLCDDEFFIPSSLDHCIEKLKEKKDFIVCGGQWLGFYCTNKKILARQMYTELKGYRVEKETARERMITHMNPYTQSTFYAVMHAKMWKKNMKILSKYSYSCVYIPEFQFELATCYQGKSIVIDELMMLKNEGLHGIRYEKLKKPLQLWEWLKENRYIDEVKNFYETTATELARIDGSNKEKVLESLKSSIATLNRFLVDREQRKNYIILKVKPKIIPFIPKKLRTQIKLAIRNCLWKSITDEADILQKEGVKVDLNQLQEIIMFMKKNVMNIVDE